MASLKERIRRLMEQRFGAGAEVMATLTPCFEVADGIAIDDPEERWLYACEADRDAAEGLLLSLTTA